MPVINVVVSEVDHHYLEQEHADLVNAWARLGHQSQPPTFAKWLGSRLKPSALVPQEDAVFSDVRLFNGIEKLITSLPQHGFHLAHTATGSADPTASSSALARAIVNDFQLQPQYAKRLQELFVHYLKSAREIADTAQVGITNRAYGALTEAHRQLTERTTDSIAKLGAEQAIGRIEGATAILVSVDVMDRSSAKKRTSAFKVQARAIKKAGWVRKIFGQP